LVPWRRYGISVGNLIGSDIFNLFGVLGLAAILRNLPVDLSARLNLVILDMMVVLVLVFMRSGWIISRKEGGYAMQNIKKILVPVDFSENSRIALDWAMSFADKLDAKVILFHALDMPAELKERAERHKLLNKDAQKRVKEEAGKYLLAFADKYDEDRISVAPEIAEGKPFVEIIKAARNYDVDLIVMGTHGRTGLQKMLIGSVAEKVVRKAPCPVLTVKHPDYKFEMP
jgi:nucleotide-binding universal stress UspA family protein